MQAIQLKDVNFKYPTQQNKILDCVNFTANYGEIALITGHTGEGKSTLLNIIGGIIPNILQGELSGELIIDNEQCLGKKLSYICRKVGLVLQNADLQIVHKIVEDEIAFGLENLAFPPEKIKNQIDLVCDLFQLEKDWETRTLSGGQKQRLITASTLAMGQKIIILDEPLANLDKKSSIALMDILKSLATAGYCVIIIEHRLDMLINYVDCVWCLKKGKLEKVDDITLHMQEQVDKMNDSSPEFIGTGENIFNIQNLSYKVKTRRRTKTMLKAKTDGGKKIILKDITLQIEKGSRTVILGENGCGKTTLLRLLAKLYKPTSGTIEQTFYTKTREKFSAGREGKFEKGRKLKRQKWFDKIGIVAQNPDYQLFMPTVLQEIAFRAKSEEYALEIAELFGLTSILDRHPQSLSQGQKRRVSIASVVVGEQEVLLLDEPTVGQDYESVCELVEILNKLHEQTKNTMITITHDMRCVEALCDRAILIQDGIVANVGGKELVKEYFNI